MWFLNYFAFSCFVRVLIFSRHEFYFYFFEVKQLHSSACGWLEDGVFEKISVRNVERLITFRRRVSTSGRAFVAGSLTSCHAVARAGEREPHALLRVSPQDSWGPRVRSG